MLKRPDTYFLQEAIDMGIETIIARLDKEQDYRPQFLLKILPEPYLGHDIWDNGDMSARYADAFILGRQVTGNDGYKQEELSLTERLYACDPYEHPFMATRVLITLVDKYICEQSEENKKRLDDLILIIRQNMKYEEDYAYYFRQPEGWSSIKEPVFGDFLPYPTYPIGGIILALTRYLETFYCGEVDEFTEKLVKFTIEHSGVFTKEGHYFGHTHSGGILTAAAGITRWAALKKDAKLMDMMRGAFEWTVKYCSSWGWVPDGLGEPNGSCETCSIADALHFALLMARHTNPAYYEIAERYARNQLMENQFKDLEKIDNVMKHSDNPQHEKAKRALYGSWASYSKPNSLDNGFQTVEGCCLGAGIRACYLVWNGAVEKRNDTVYVNMAFSRNSPWIELISYQPYEGRIDIIVRDAEKIMVHIPSWANRNDVRISVNSMPVCADYEDVFLKFSGMKKDDHIKIEYPLSVNIKNEMVNGTAYSVEWKGDTVVGINPKGALYPIFERKYAKKNIAPMSDGQPYKHQTGGPVFW
ncbi:MAG: glycoside hydrolase family 127 protein [Oscillospiraceae bacterium]|nr:glycoside hydrolase family 127 protein [Oscillospiraceae bacterium]